MSSRQRNSASSKAWLEKMRVDGQVRATRAAQERVVAATAIYQRAGLSPFEAAVKAIAEETGKPLVEARAWFQAQTDRYKDFKAKLEAQFAEQEKAS